MQGRSFERQLDGYCDRMMSIREIRVGVRARDRHGRASGLVYERVVIAAGDRVYRRVKGAP